MKRGWGWVGAGKAGKKHLPSFKLSSSFTTVFQENGIHPVKQFRFISVTGKKLTWLRRVVCCLQVGGWGQTLWIYQLHFWASISSSALFSGVFRFLLLLRTEQLSLSHCTHTANRSIWVSLSLSLSLSAFFLFLYFPLLPLSPLQSICSTETLNGLIGSHWVVHSLPVHTLSLSVHRLYLLS